MGKILARVSVRGVVQGVGFRPFVYQLATKNGLAGWVRNTSGDVRIEVEGAKENVERFLAGLEKSAPPMARIEDVAHSFHPPAGYRTFEIRPSSAEEGKYQLVSPDIATCAPCLGEVFDPADRRYRYPFTNCTNCGPRFTIITDIPYDRPNTTMRAFTMCPRCSSEYDDPLDRRFHAQPNACPVCGPRLELVDTQGSPVAGDPILEASRRLKAGHIVAVKGLGGFLLACDATSERAVTLLRERKRRPSKPLAVMVGNLDEAHRHCEVSNEEAKLLTSPQGPIVLLGWRPDSSVSQAVAPGLRYLGVMLPYTPLHHLLLRETGRPLVMTSGNMSEEPIAAGNDEAARRLGKIADYFLRHNREIYARYDDSVTLVEAGTTQLVRRARGYAPSPIRLPFAAGQALGCGAEDKVTFCLTRDNYAFVSQHIGDMENLETLEHYKRTIELYRHLFRAESTVIACDLHPEYLTTRFARELAGEAGAGPVYVQHHHAHIASCMADNSVTSPVIGVAFDGTGYGADGHLWGGEFLVADYHGFQRAGHLEYLPLPGGAAAIKKPYRTAIGYGLALFGPETALPPFEIPLAELEVIKRQIERKMNTPLTSSMGRLFDAVSAIAGIRGEIDYEGQAAIDLEMAAYDCPGETAAYPYRIETEAGVHIIRLGELISAVIRDQREGVSPAGISARFHNTVAGMVVQMCRLISETTGIRQVALSGGVFQNRRLLRLVIPELSEAGFTVLTHRQVPAGDGGVSLGQAAIASHSV